MREIKFRAWNLRDKKMYQNVQECEEYYNACFSSWLKPEFDALMQFTGLKDKDGKEIYEGDILSCENTPFPKLLLIVYWDEKRAIFNLRQGENTTTSFLLSENYLYEVIGNIYENANLHSYKIIHP